ncbi:MAG: patatin-like phospholipase family protein [candidate division NC10 bacterium]|nr:patatin-like phospholipase family protein [candidate division NC10 bacterium]
MTALVLCGGGSRGAVEVGLYRALVDLRVPIDLVVGTSVGAINGAAVAARIPPDDLAKLWRGLTRPDVFVLNRQLVWKLLWADSLYDHRPLRRFLERALPVRTFEELAIPLIVTGTDVATGRPVYWREGDLLDAIMASVAVPGLFPPQLIGGAQMVDGGISDNVPIDVAVAEGATTVVLMLCACCERVSRPVRGLVPILRRALAIAIDRKYHAEIQHYAGRADVIVLEPPIDLAIDPLDFTHTDELIERGYASAMAALKDRIDVGRARRRRWAIAWRAKGRTLWRSLIPG